MESPTTVLALAVGFHLAVALLLVAHHVELRAVYVLWWLAGVAALAAGAVVDLGALALPVPLGLVLLRATLQLAGAGFFLTGSVARDPRARGVTVVGTLGFGALVLAVVAALLLTRPAGPSLALAHGIVGTAAGLAFLLAAEGYRRAERILDDAGALLIFAGLAIAGLNFIGWAWITQTPGVSAAAGLLSGVFILVFGAGVLMRSVQRARRLVILSQLTTALHGSGTVHDLLRDVLERAGDLLELRSGWVFLRQPGTNAYELAASYHLPRELEANRQAAMRGTCRCLELLMGQQLTEPVNILDCMRLEQVGTSARHASVPLRTSTGFAGMMNLVLPAGRLFGQRELALLATVGGEVGLAIEKTQLLEELAVTERVRGELIKRVLTVQEDERRRIARELHDETGQSLSALILNLDMARAALEEEPRAVEVFDRLKGLAETTLDEVRKLIYDLRPTVLDDLGLTAALRWFAHHQVEPHGIEIGFNVRLGETRLDGVIETTLFRIAQEAMWNIVKHSGATQAGIELSLLPHRVRLRVQDNGRGFPLDGQRAIDPLRGGLGLGSMRERAALMGGTLTISSGEGRGTEVVAELPLAAHDGE